MNDAVAIVVPNGGDDRRQIHHVAADQSNFSNVDADGTEQPFIQRNVEYHRAFAAVEQHAHRVGPDKTGTTGDENSFFSHNNVLRLGRASTISNGMLSQRSARNYCFMSRLPDSLDLVLFSSIMSAGSSKHSEEEIGYVLPLGAFLFDPGNCGSGEFVSIGSRKDEACLGGLQPDQ